MKQHLIFSEMLCRRRYPFLMQMRRADDHHQFGARHRRLRILGDLPEIPVDLLGIGFPSIRMSGPQRLRDVLGDDEAERLLKGGARIIQINVWRPIVGPVERTPLALADASSISPEDLIATDQIFPDRVGEIYHVAFGPEQRWYYAPQMTRDEVILIKGWDSLEDGRARFTPHTAFELPDARPNAPPRQSIETRTLVIIEDGAARPA